MSRRNFAWLLAVAVLSVACYERAQTNRHARALGGALDRVSRRFVGPVPDPKEFDSKLFQGAMEGMMKRLDDPNSVYINPARVQPFRETLNEEFEGVGMKLTLDPKTKELTVAAPLPGSPAEEAGIRPGDKIIKIDGRSTQGMTPKDASDRIRGKPETEVAFSVLHEGDKEPVELKIERRKIQADTVRGDRRNPPGTQDAEGKPLRWNYFVAGHDRIGYVRITSFVERDNGTVEELTRALDWLTQHDMRGLVLDLRDNPGGSLGAAIAVCNLFVKSGVILTTRGRDERVLRSFEADGKARFTDFPMAVLVNPDSASASEIVAACLQDHQRAIVVGQRSYGKGTVQEVSSLGPDCGELKLTVATYWRPSGRNIDRIDRRRGKEKNGQWGVTPDEGYEVTVGTDELERWRHGRELRDVLGPPRAKPNAPPFADRVLEKAVEYLEKGL